VTFIGYNGVDAPLANLFVAAARPVPSEEEGVNQRVRGILISPSRDFAGDARIFQVNADLPTLAE
jgi:hypothetical protein